jgi:hypothetical protein
VPAPRGQTQTEVAILLVATAVVCLLVVVTFGDRVAALFGVADEEVSELSGGEAWDPGAPAGEPQGPEGGTGDEDGVGDGGGGRGGDSSRARPGDQGGRDGRGAGPSGEESGVEVAAPGPPRQGITGLDGEDDSRKVIAPGEARRGSAAWDRQHASRTSQSGRAQEEERWSARRRQDLQDQGLDEDRGASGPTMPDILRYLLLAALLVGGILLARVAMGGRGKGGGAES